MRVLTVFLTGSTGVSVLNVCPVEQVTEEDHFPLIFYSGLRGRLLSLNETSKLEKV